MTLKTENGWEAIESQSDPKLVVIRIPGTGIPGIPLRLRKEAAPLLAYVASRVHTEVSDLKQGNKPGVQDDGGYNYRVIDNSTKLSNHASGTAMDLNWNKYPMFKKKMSKSERAAAEALAAELSEVIRWGGNYSATRVDEMHWEIAPKVTAAQIAKFCKEHGIDKFGKVK